MRLWQREVLGGVPILRVPLYPSHSSSGLRRILSYGSFACSALPALLLGWKPDVIHVYGLVTKGISATLVRKVRGTPFVFDIQDLWPDAVVNSGMGSSWMVRPISAACQWVYRNASKIVVLSPGFKQRLIGRGVPASKIEVIYNWCDEDALAGGNGGGPPKPERGLENRFNILFAGGMGRAQGLGAVIEAAAITGSTHPYIQFVLMGGGRMLDELKAKARAVAPGTTLFLERRPIAEAAAVLKAADVLLVHLRRHPLYNITIPSKTQAYMAIGKPILIGVGGDAAELIGRAGAGVSCEPETPESIAAAAVQLAEFPASRLEEMGRKGRQFYQCELSLRHGAARLEAVYREVVSGRASVGRDEV